ncbi:MAG: class I SAM-dependent methyltransferase [Nitrospirae bacterium]|nr:class I SAM-dependent methyltransferase [Nitrospirota bacterium]
MLINDLMTLLDKSSDLNTIRSGLNKIDYFTYDQIIDIAISMIRIFETRKVLDVGCYDGNLMKLFFKNGWNCYGVDIDDRKFDIASQYGSVRKVAQPDGLPYEDNSFDLITCVNVLHHASDYKKLCSEMVRVLKPAGIFIIHEIVEDSPIIRYGRNLYPKYKDMDVLSRFTVAELVGVFENNSLINIDIFIKTNTVYILDLICMNLIRRRPWFIKYFRIKREEIKADRFRILAPHLMIVGSTNAF